MDARDAVGVLFDPEVLKLVAVVIAGWWLRTTRVTGRGEFATPLQLLYDGLATLTWLTGTVIYYGAILALLVKLVYEATCRANSS